MLTINNSQLSKRQFLSFGLRLQPAMLQQNNANNYNSINSYPTLSRIPVNDIFIKNNNAAAKNISFGESYYDDDTQKYESHRPKQINEVSLESDYYKKFAEEVQKKMDQVWEWTSKRPRYQTYFKRLNIEKPKLVFVTKRDYPDYSPEKSEYLKYDGGVPTRYNWINNTIIVDTDYFPNVILASQGRIAISPKAVAGDFIYNKNLPDPEREREGNISPSAFEDLGKRSLDFAITDSDRNSTSYFTILNPKEAAELAPSLLAHEAEHAVAMHVLLNTKGLNMQKLKDAFNRLSDTDMLPPQTTENWKHAYPYKYRKRLSSLEFGKDDLWKIRDADGNSLKRLKHSELLEEFFRQYDRYDPYSSELQNLIELDARYASISYLKNQRLSGFSETSAERLGLALEFQEETIWDDIKRRLEWTNLTLAAKKVRGKKPASANDKKKPNTGGKKN